MGALVSLTLDRRRLYDHKWRRWWFGIGELCDFWIHHKRENTTFQGNAVIRYWRCDHVLRTKRRQMANCGRVLYVVGQPMIKNVWKRSCQRL